VSSSEDLVVRRAVADDVAAIVALLADDEIGALRESPDDLTPYRNAFKVIDTGPHELLIVAERGGHVVGTLQLSLLPGLSRRGPPERRSRTSAWRAWSAAPHWEPA
jgi:hypothetical protein